MRPTLEELARKFGCDKLHSHSYVPYYSKLFEGRNVKRVWEIGIGFELLMSPFVPFFVKGASLKMWAEMWPEAEIFGCDIREDTLFQEGRIRTFQCDQSDPLDLLAGVRFTGGNVDVIIDDGSHRKDHQILTAKTLLPYVAVNGVYVIEDVAKENVEEVARTVGGMPVRFERRSDDNLIVCRKSRDPYVY